MDEAAEKITASGNEGQVHLAKHLGAIMLKNNFYVILTLLSILFFPCNFYAADSILTEQQRQEIDQLMELALANPRKNGERNLAKIQEMGLVAVEYATPKVAELLYVPQVIDPKAGFDFVLMEALKFLRGKVKLEERHLVRLREIEKSDNKDHATFARLVLGFQVAK